MLRQHALVRQRADRPEYGPALRRHLHERTFLLYVALEGPKLLGAGLHGVDAGPSAALLDEHIAGFLLLAGHAEDQVHIHL